MEMRWQGIGRQFTRSRHPTWWRHVSACVPISAYLCRGGTGWKMQLHASLLAIFYKRVVHSPFARVAAGRQPTYTEYEPCLCMWERGGFLRLINIYFWIEMNYVRRASCNPGHFDWKSVIRWLCLCDDGQMGFCANDEQRERERERERRVYFWIKSNIWMNALDFSMFLLNLSPCSFSLWLKRLRCVVGSNSSRCSSSAEHWRTQENCKSCVRSANARFVRCTLFCAYRIQVYCQEKGTEVTSCTTKYGNALPQPVCARVCHEVNNLVWTKLRTFVCRL